MKEIMCQKKTLCSYCNHSVFLFELGFRSEKICSSCILKHELAKCEICGAIATQQNVCNTCIDQHGYAQCCLCKNFVPCYYINDHSDVCNKCNGF